MTLLRGDKRVAARRTRTRHRAFRVMFRVRRAGRYRGLVTTTLRGQRVSARTKVAKLPRR